MSKFQVTIYTRVREVYYVEADSAEEAAKNWSEFPVDISESMEIVDGPEVEAVSS